MATGVTLLGLAGGIPAGPPAPWPGLAVLGAVVVVVVAPVDGVLEAVVVPAELEAGAAEDVAGAAVGEV